jgi:hypothetical protein
VIAFLFLWFSAVFVDSPGLDGRTPAKVEAVQTKAVLIRENQKRERKGQCPLQRGFALTPLFQSPHDYLKSCREFTAPAGEDSTG